MPGRKLSHGELKAAALVAAVLGGVIEPRDVDGAPERTHDFDILVGDQTVALEVTTAADAAHASMEAVAYSGAFSAPGLTSSWALGLPMGGGGNIRVKRVVKQAPTHLAVLEAYARRQVFELDELALHGEPPAVVAAARALRQLGLKSVVALDGAHESVLFFTGHGGGTANPDRVNVLVVPEAVKNAPKLLAARADERHLFVWIVDVDSGGELAMQVGVLPSAAPELPLGIDAVWAASSRGAHTWRCRPPAGWEALSVSENAVDALCTGLAARLE